MENVYCIKNWKARIPGSNIQIFQTIEFWIVTIHLLTEHSLMRLVVKQHTTLLQHRLYFPNLVIFPKLKVSSNGVSFNLMKIKLKWTLERKFQ
jgi:hypothetical protein